MNRSQVKLRKKQLSLTNNWLHNQILVAAQLVPARKSIEPDIETVRLPDCQPWTIQKAL